MGACPIEPTLVFLSFLFFSFLFSFVSFSFLLTLFFPFTLKNMLCFLIPSYKARQEPLYSAYRDQGFTILPLNRLCLVWAYLPTTRGVCHSPLPDRGRFQFSPCHNTSFLPQYKCFLSLLSEHAPTVPPSNLPFLGGLSSQQDVPPERGLGRSRKQIFSPLPTTKPHPLYLLPLAHGPTMSCIG